MWPPLQQRHVQVAPRPPLAPRDVLQPCGDEHEGGVPVGERPHDAGSPADLAVQPLDGVVRADPPPVGGGEPRVRQGLGAAIAGGLRGPLEPHGLQLVGDLGGLPLRRPAGLHGVDRLEHRGDPGALRLGHPREDVPAEVRGAALVGGAGEDLGDRAGHAGRLVAGERAHAAQAAGPRPREELAPALGRLREALRGAYDLAVAVVVHADGHHRGDVLVAPAPGPLEVYPVHVDVGVGALQGPVPPLLDRREGPLVQVGDGRRGDARAPEDLAHVLDAPGGDAREARPGHRLLDRGLPAPAAPDDRRGGPHPLEPGHADRDLAGRRREPPLVVPGAVGLAVGGPLVAPRPDEVVGLLVQQSARHLLDGPPDELAQGRPSATPRSKIQWDRAWSTSSMFLV